MGNLHVKNLFISLILPMSIYHFKNKIHKLETLYHICTHITWIILQAVIQTSILRLCWCNLGFLIWNIIIFKHFLFLLKEFLKLFLSFLTSVFNNSDLNIDSLILIIHHTSFYDNNADYLVFYFDSFLS